MSSGHIVGDGFLILVCELYKCTKLFHFYDSLISFIGYMYVLGTAGVEALGKVPVYKKCVAW